MNFHLDYDGPAFSNPPTRRRMWRIGESTHTVEKWEPPDAPPLWSASFGGTRYADHKLGGGSASCVEQIRAHIARLEEIIGFIEGGGPP